MARKAPTRFQEKRQTHDACRTSRPPDQARQRSAHRPRSRHALIVPKHRQAVPLRARFLCRLEQPPFVPCARRERSGIVAISSQQFPANLARAHSRTRACSSPRFDPHYQALQSTPTHGGARPLVPEFENIDPVDLCHSESQRDQSRSQAVRGEKPHPIARLYSTLSSLWLRRDIVRAAALSCAQQRAATLERTRKGRVWLRRR